ESEAIQSYLDSMIDKLLQGQTGKFKRPRLLIVSADRFDGRSDAKGNLIVSTETLRMIESEDELAALLGHELSHVVLDHPARKSVVTMFPAAVGTLSSLVAAGDQVV